MTQESSQDAGAARGEERDRGHHADGRCHYHLVVLDDHEALDQMLADQAETAGSERRAKGVVSLPREAPRQEHNDFQQLSFVFGAAPKVIWIRRGNCTVREIEDILRTNAGQIQTFEADAESSSLVL